MRTHFLLFLILLATLPNLSDALKWDIEYWQQVNNETWKCGAHKLNTSGEMRFRKKLSKFYFIRLTEGYAYQASKHLDFEAHYSFFYSQNVGSLHLANRQRLDLEANPSYSPCKNVNLKWRNRLEFIKRQNVYPIVIRFRHLFKVVFPFEESQLINSINFSSEIFYDFEHNKFIQNRFIPFEISFALNEKTCLDLFVMLRKFYSFTTNQWHRSLVLGSEVGF